MRITNIPLLKAAFLLLMVISFAHTSPPYNCDTKPIKAVGINSMCSGRFLRVNGSEVKADSLIDYKIYMVTHANDHAFLMYDPQQNRFICLRSKRRKKIFIAKRLPNPVNQCLFDEIPVPETIYTMYRIHNKTLNSSTQDNRNSTRKNNIYLSFNWNGVQKQRKKFKCAQLGKESYAFSNVFLKKQQRDTPCEEHISDFCIKMRKLNHKPHNHLPEIIRHYCKLTRS